MARSISKRKKPQKDDYQLKERFKIESEVFDKRVLIILAKMIKKGLLETVDYPISTGKEANVFRAKREDGSFIAIKIYKNETAPFLRKADYLEGDPRFEKLKHNDREIVRTFARKEFKNLQLAHEAGVNCPKPLYLIDNVLLMEFIGEGELPYPTMNLSGPNNPKKDLESILQDIRKMYKAGFVHADLSEYNILASPKPTIIDFGQGVILRHPNAEKFLLRDVSIILKFFEKFGIKKELEKTIKWIKED